MGRRTCSQPLTRSTPLLSTPERWPEALDPSHNLGGLGAVIVPIPRLTDGDHWLTNWMRHSDYNREWLRYHLRNERRSARGITDGLITDARPPG